ncbi:unnamed protein product [Ambrosiozyma monospora]|uniref:Unnamed protein product n=1 Tax=Ambrosiozyma monospora TaxID=43982 RepID=A0A9W6Z4E2_AMBMO|nr:unnamed protein product [Ambrosiozyma monospora]
MAPLTQFTQQQQNFQLPLPTNTTSELLAQLCMNFTIALSLITVILAFTSKFSTQLFFTSVSSSTITCKEIRRWSLSAILTLWITSIIHFALDASTELNLIEDLLISGCFMVAIFVNAYNVLNTFLDASVGNEAADKRAMLLNDDEEILDLELGLGI